MTAINYMGREGKARSKTIVPKGVFLAMSFEYHRKCEFYLVLDGSKISKPEE